MSIIESKSPNFNEIYNIWYKSVQATHNFLAKKDFELIDSIVKDIFPQVQEYISYYKEDKLIGFIGFNNPDIEMFFLHPDFLGQKIGYELISYLKTKYNHLKIDVNKQNINAYNAYLKYGFKVVGESEKDSLNLPYPIVHMEWFL